MIRSSQSMNDFVMVSEKLRKKFSEQLRLQAAKNDVFNNTIFELNQNKKLNDIKHTLTEEKLNLVFDSVNSISNAKEIEDKMQFKINRL